MTFYSQSPDRWLILPQLGSARHEGRWHRVFATWAGGYIASDRWRLNSGIDNVTEDGDYFYVNSEHSGTVYRLHKGSEGIAGSSNYYTLDSFLKSDAGIEKPIADGPAFLRSIIRAKAKINSDT